jgi:hypothetical protein
MQPEEIVAIGELAGDALGSATTRVEDLHSGIAERVFGSIGEAAEPVRVVHDGIARGAYAAVRGATGVLARVGAARIGAASSPDAPSLTESTRGRVAMGALNGAFGDELARRGNPLTVELGVYAGGRPVDPTGEALARAFPVARPRVAIFLHGLCETEEAWQLRADRYVPYGARLEAELGYSPVYVATTAAATSPRTGASWTRCWDGSAPRGRSRSARSL